MKSPVRFMARGLAETASHENPVIVASSPLHERACDGGEWDGSGGGGRSGRGGSRHAPALRPAIIQ